jgi:electron transfer flavoprotein beta subunit
VNILVCVKRVPATGGKIVLTADAQDIDTRFLGFTISPHEECGVEEAVRIVEAQGGSSTVLTLGPEVASEQLRDAMAIGIDNAVLLQTDGSDWDAYATAGAIADAIHGLEAEGGTFDLILFGNEAADTGDFQVGIRVATALGRPVVSGIKGITAGERSVEARREAAGGWEVFDLPMPAVLGVKEGLNLPRYPSVPGRLRARKKEIRTLAPAGRPGGPTKERLRLPEGTASQVEVIGQGAGAAPAVVELLQRLGVVGR